MRANFKPVDPDRQRREMQREFKAFSRSEPSPERTARLATFTREAHVERQLNMAMHTAVLCLDADPDQPELLLAAYLDPEHDPESRLRAWSDLHDLARYIDRDDIVQRAMAALHKEAEDWVRTCDAAERRQVLRTLGNIVSRAFADDVRDAVAR